MLLAELMLLRIGDEMCSTFIILVVEDDVMIRDYIRNMLKAAGYEVITAGTGTEALESLGRHGKPDLMFTDVHMGDGMTGIELALTARRMFPDLKILFSTGYIGPAEHDLIPDGTEVLAKPYRRKDCLEKVRAMVAGDWRPL